MSEYQLSQFSSHSAESDVTTHTTQETFAVLSDVTTQEILAVLDLVLQYFVCSVLGLCGVVGNVLSIVVLLQLGLAQSTNLLLLSLTFCDLVYCGFEALKAVRFLVDSVDRIVGMTLDTMWLAYIINIQICASYCSNTHVLIIAVERFTAVFFPFHVSRLFTTKTLKVLIVVCYVYVCLPVSTLAWTMLTHTWVLDPGSNRTYAVLSFSPFYLHHVESLDMFGGLVINNLFLTVSVLVVLVSCVAASLKMLHARKSKLHQTSSKSLHKADAKVSKMLLSVCACYALFNIPTICFEVFKSCSPLEQKSTTIFIFLQNSSEILYLANSSMNFVLYMTSSTKFSNTYKKLFRRNSYR